MRNILSGARGMSPVVLVILIAWALLSVIFLTGTLLAARSIDRSVSGVTNRTDANGKPEKNIYDTVQEIGTEGKFIDEAKKTVAISTAIRKAAAPLSGHLARTLTIADKGILPRLNTINEQGPRHHRRRRSDQLERGQHPRDGRSDRGQRARDQRHR